MENRKQNIYDTFINSGLHQERFVRVKDVYAIAQFRGVDGIRRILRTNNTCSLHAEETLISHLTRYLTDGNLPSQTISIYINFSPCSACSKRLLKFNSLAKKYGIDFNMKLRFASLYKLQRPSRNGKMDARSQIIQESNLRWLQRLDADGYDLGTFCNDEWQFMAWYLQVPHNVPSQRQDEDDLMRRDFQMLTAHWRRIWYNVLLREADTAVSDCCF